MKISHYYYHLTYSFIYVFLYIIGQVFSKETLLNIITWCRSHQIHIICDEIYALSVFDDTVQDLTNSNATPTSTNDNNVRFESIVKILDNNLQSDIHVLWGFSKDLGASGLRIGVFYSQNKALLTDHWLHSVGGLSLGLLKYLPTASVSHLQP